MTVRGLSDFLAGRGVGGVVTCGSEIDCPVVPGSNMGNVAQPSPLQWALIERAAAEMSVHTPAPSGAEACTSRDQGCQRARAEGARKIRTRKSPNAAVEQKMDGERTR